MSELTQEYLKSILDYDQETGIFTWKVSFSNKVKIGSVANSKHNAGYLCVRINYKSYLLHRLAWFYVHGVWPEYQIDHINLNRKDNRLSNLRSATNQENNNNRTRCHKNNKSGFLGVFYCKIMKRYVSKIMVDGKSINLGYFETPIEAHDEYIKQKRILHKGCTL